MLILWAINGILVCLHDAVYLSDNLLFILILFPQQLSLFLIINWEYIRFVIFQTICLF